MDKRSLQFILTLVAILAATVALFLYGKGYTYDRQSQSLEKTGMMIVKSAPDGARIYLNDRLTQVTNANLTNLKGGLYRLRLEKDGFALLQKEVPVKEEFVTVVEAVLVPLNPELKPLTTTGVTNPRLTASRDKILFSTTDKEKPGIWALTLSGNVFSLIRGNLDLVVADQEKGAFSLAENLFLSPSDEQLLVRMNKKGFYLLDLTQVNVVPQATTSAETILKEWSREESLKKLQLAQKYKVPKNLLKIATQPASTPAVVAEAALWSPDERRFLYGVSKGKNLEYHVYDTSDPLGIGEKEDYTVLTVEKTRNSKISWFSDSRHLVISSCESESKEKFCLSGTINLIRIDGSNNTQVYSGALSSTDVFPTPDGSKIIILTSFNQTVPANLYAIILR